MDGNRFEDLRQQIESRRREMTQEIANLAAHQFTGEAADGSVRVTVNGTGAVQDVRVDPTRLDTIRGDELGWSVVNAAARARGASDAAARAASEGILGDVDALQGLGERLWLRAHGERE